jgi:hypothetical protein
MIEVERYNTSVDGQREQKKGEIMAPVTTRFEPIGTDKAGWWGEPTSSLDWCERNYEQTV